MRRMSGLAARARATPTRCRCPPDSWVGYRRAKEESRPTLSSKSIARVRAAVRETPERRGTAAMLSTTVRWGSNPPDCMTYPIWRRSLTGLTVATSVSSMSIRPSDGSTIRLTIRSRVVLPHPEDPRRTTRWCDSTVSSKLSTATVPSSKRLLTWSKRIMWSFLARRG